MVITTTFRGVTQKWIEQEIENGIYHSPQELVRAAVRRLREQSLLKPSPTPTAIPDLYGSLLDEISGREIKVDRDFRIPVGAKGGNIVEFTFHELPPDAKIKITAKVPGYSRTYKDTPWFFLEKSKVESLEIYRSPKHQNRWIVHLPLEERDDLEVYVLDFRELVRNMEGCEHLEPRSLSTIRFEGLPQEKLEKVRVFEGK